MNICIIGLGSIGQRHLRNIHAVAAQRGVDVATDVVEPRELDYLDGTTRPLVRNRFAAPDGIGHYDMIFVTNPSQLHEETLSAVKDKADFFFVEKPVFTQALSDDALAPYADERKFYVACPIRHTRVYGFLSEFVPQNEVYCVRAICSSYLPEWRPGTDYRRTYAAQEGSGGVKLDLIHEFDYLFTLFGLPETAHLLEGKFSALELKSVDGVSFVGRYPDKTLELHLDYYGRVPRREIELYTADDVVVCDFIKAEIRFLKSGRRVYLAEERNEYCLREIAYFFDFALSGAANINSIPYANSIIGFVTNDVARPPRPCCKGEGALATGCGKGEGALATGCCKGEGAHATGCGKGEGAHATGCGKGEGALTTGCCKGEGALATSNILG